MAKKVTPNTPIELKQLADQVGAFMEYWGFKKVHGQLWTHIYLSARPIDSTTLSKRLKVSKALVSLAMKDLLQYDVVQIASKGVGRKIFFRSNPDLIKVIVNVLKSREQKMLAQIMKSHKNLKNISAAKGDTLGLSPDKALELGKMILSAQGSLDFLISSNLIVKS
jgi:DNA-binding transcriptional regulator GbsR (MarR family)